MAQAASGTATATPILELRDVSLHFGGITALDGVGFTVNKGEIFAVIGPNGAGKTSVFNCISGLYHPAKGSILFEGRDITGLTPARRARLGLARSFQNIELFKGMTVIDNLMLGRHIHMKTGLLTGGLFFGPARREEIRNREVVEEIIDFLEIQAIRQKVVGTLAYGLQKRVELGRALALAPRVLLLDEPMAGMNAEETEDMARFVLDISEERDTTHRPDRARHGRRHGHLRPDLRDRLRRQARRRHAGRDPGQPERRQRLPRRNRRALQHLGRRR